MCLTKFPLLNVYNSPPACYFLNIYFLYNQNCVVKFYFLKAPSLILFLVSWVELGRPGGLLIEVLSLEAWETREFRKRRWPPHISPQKPRRQALVFSSSERMQTKFRLPEIINSVIGRVICSRWCPELDFEHMKILTMVKPELKL